MLLRKVREVESQVHSRLEVGVDLHGRLLLGVLIRLAACGGCGSVLAALLRQYVGALCSATRQLSLSGGYPEHCWL